MRIRIPDLVPRQGDANLRPLICRPSMAPFGASTSPFVSVPPWLHFEPPHLLNFDMDADPDPDFDFDANPDPYPAFTLSRIRHPKIMQIRIRPQNSFIGARDQ